MGDQFDAKVLALLTSWFVEEGEECVGYFQDIIYHCQFENTKSKKSAEI